MAVHRVQRFRTLPNAGNRTIFFKIDHGRLGKFFRPDEVPAFDGEEAWFEMEKVKGRWRFIRQVGRP